MCVYVYVCVCKTVYVYVCVCMCVYVCVYVHVYVCVCDHTLAKLSVNIILVPKTRASSAEDTAFDKYWSFT